MTITAAAATTTTTTTTQYPQGGEARASYKYIVYVIVRLTRRDAFDCDHVVSHHATYMMKHHHFLPRFKSRETFLQLILPTFEFVSSHYVDACADEAREHESFFPNLNDAKLSRNLSLKIAIV